MRRMSKEEILQTIKACNWATICTCSEAGEPYAVEATPFYINGATGFMINPRGGTWRNLQNNTKVLLKYTLTAPDLSGWIGVSCTGEGAFITDPEAIREGWKLLGEVMGQDYSGAAEKFSKKTSHSPFLSVKVRSMSGRCSAPKEGPLPSLAR